MLRFVGLCSLYSLGDAILFHPLSVAAAVSELHRSSIPSLSLTSDSSWLQRLHASFRGSLSIREAVEKIVAGDARGGKSCGLVISALYTGLPVTCFGLFFFRLFEMVPYKYISAWLEDYKRSKNLPWWFPTPVASGAIATLLCTPIVNPSTVLSRLQVHHRCKGEPYDVAHLLRQTLPSMEGGRFKVLFRGSLVGLLSAAPSAAIRWQVFESTRDALETRLSSSLIISIIAGATSGTAGLAATRPISLEVSRMQTDTDAVGFLKTAKIIYRTEGIAAFSKGFAAKLLVTAPRNALFFCAFQTLRGD
jgi:hypothetical protein